jgi:hypothetical protein
MLIQGLYIRQRFCLDLNCRFYLFNSVYQETHQDSSKFYTPASNTAVSLFRIVVNVSMTVGHGEYILNCEYGRKMSIMKTRNSVDMNRTSRF